MTDAIKWIVLCLMIVLFFFGPVSKVKADSIISEKNQSGSGTDEAWDETWDEATDDALYEIAVNYKFPNVQFEIYDMDSAEAGLNGKQEYSLKAFQIQRTDQNGQACFKGIGTGNYLIAGEEHEWDRNIYRPVISEIHIPDGWQSGTKKIIINPKYEKEPVEPTEEETPDKEPEQQLPQTGQLWVPVLFLGCFGILFLVAGYFRKKQQSDVKQ